MHKCIGWSWYHKVLQKVVQFLYGMFNKELKFWMQNVILLQPGQSILADVFQLSEIIRMNMVEEQVVTIGFNRENLKSFSTPSNK
jgi:hypothetical protein